MTAFLGIAFFTAVVGGVAMFNLKKIASGDSDLYNNSEVAVGILGQLSTSFQIMRSDERDLILADKAENKKAASDKIDARKSEIMKFFEDLDHYNNDNDEAHIYESMKKSSEAYFTAQPKTLERAVAGKNEDALKSLYGEEETARKEF
jgi:hypothetical protein